jgi:hypothetical protein
VVAADRLHRLVRLLCVGIVFIQVPLGFGLYRQWSWMVDAWPLPDARMTFIFYASIVAAIAAPLAWAAWRDELGVLESIGFELMIGAPVVGGYLAWLALDRRDGALGVFAVASLAMGVAAATLWQWARRVDLRDNRPLPTLYRACFVGFCCVLVPVGIALILRRDAFPWRPSPENATIIGLVFLSAALLFAWIAAHPKWAYGEMAMTAFLAYDLVLLVPYLDLLRQRDDVTAVSSYYGGDPAYAAATGDNGINELSLTLYLGVLAVSALLAVGMYAWGYRTRPVMQPAMGN